MVQNYNTISLGTGQRTTTGILVPSNVGGSGVIDASNTDWLAFNLTISGSATVQVEVSFDNGTTWYPVYTIKGADSTTQPNANASGLWFGNTIGPLARLNVTAVSGTVTLNGGTTDVTNAPNGTPSQVSLNQAGGNGVNSSPNTPAATGFFTASAATTNATLVAASAKGLLELDITNGSASTVYLKLYNKASAPTVGTDVPVLTIPVAAGATAIQEFGALGKKFSTGIAFAITGAAADTDATAVTTGVKVGGTYY